MTLFLGTLIIVGLGCLAMSLGLLLSDRPLSGGCGTKPSCGNCPNRLRRGTRAGPGGESEC